MSKISAAIFLMAIVVEVVHCATVNISSEVDKCLDKLNIPEDFLDNLKVENLSEEDKKKFVCSAGCLIKGEVAKEGKTIHQYVLSHLTEVEAASEVDILREKLNSCEKVGNDECKFLECLQNAGDPWKSRIDSWIVSFIADENSRK